MSVGFALELTAKAGNTFHLPEVVFLEFINYLGGLRASQHRTLPVVHRHPRGWGLLRLVRLQLGHAELAAVVPDDQRGHPDGSSAHRGADADALGSPTDSRWAFAVGPLGRYGNQRGDGRRERQLGTGLGRTGAGDQRHAGRSHHQSDASDRGRPPRVP